MYIVYTQAVILAYLYPRSVIRLLYIMLFWPILQNEMAINSMPFFSFFS